MRKTFSSLMVVALAALVISCGGSPSRIERGSYFWCFVVDRDEGGNDKRRYYTGVFRADPVHWKTYAVDFASAVKSYYGGNADERNCFPFGTAAEARENRKEYLERDATGDYLRPIETGWRP